MSERERKRESERAGKMCFRGDNKCVCARACVRACVLCEFVSVCAHVLACVGVRACVCACVR